MMKKVLYMVMICLWIIMLFGGSLILIASYIGVTK